MTINFNEKKFKLIPVGPRYRVDYTIGSTNQRGFVVARTTDRIWELLRMQQLVAGLELRPVG